MFSPIPNLHNYCTVWLRWEPSINSLPSVHFSSPVPCPGIACCLSCCPHGLHIKISHCAYSSANQISRKWKITSIQTTTTSNRASTLGNTTDVKLYGVCGFSKFHLTKHTGQAARGLNLLLCLFHCGKRKASGTEHKEGGCGDPHPVIVENPQSTQAGTCTTAGPGWQGSKCGN